MSVFQHADTRSWLHNLRRQAPFSPPFVNVVKIWLFVYDISGDVRVLGYSAASILTD